MALKRFLVALIFVAVMPCEFSPGQSARAVSASDLTVSPLSGNDDFKKYLEEFRTQGPRAVQEFWDLYGAKIEKDRNEANPDSRTETLRSVLDQICAQKDCEFSRLYWYTDWAKAQKQARAERKPILYLRLLGRLDETLSCANSRFFRAVLYSDPEVSGYLRDHFILYWKSERPVPKVTIDFGENGRKIETTVAGNSLHYILDPEGRVIDVLPGLYGPQPFLKRLKEAEAVVGDLAKAQDFQAVLKTYYQRQLASLDEQWKHDLKALNRPDEPLLLARVEVAAEAPSSTESHPAQKQRSLPESTPASQPVAEDRSKFNFYLDKAELDLSFLGETRVDLDFLDLSHNLRAEQARFFKPFLRLHPDSSALSDSSLLMIRRQNASLCFSQAKTDQALCEAMIRKFQDYLAMDTAQSEYHVRPQILVWLVEGAGKDFEKLNDKIYTELFQTSRSNVWLGLDEKGTFTGIPQAGIKEGK